MESQDRRTWEIQRAYERGRGDAFAALVCGALSGFAVGALVGYLLGVM